VKWTADRCASRIVSGNDDRSDPRQAILALLASEAPGHEIDLSTVCFGQEKASAQHRAHAVTYQGSEGETARGRAGRMTFFRRFCSFRG